MGYRILGKRWNFLWIS